MKIRFVSKHFSLDFDNEKIRLIRDGKWSQVEETQNFRLDPSFLKDHL